MFSTNELDKGFYLLSYYPMLNSGRRKVLTFHDLSSDAYCWGRYRNLEQVFRDMDHRRQSTVGGSRENSPEIELQLQLRLSEMGFLTVGMS